MELSRGSAFDVFEQIHIVNLRHRTDRRELMLHQLSRLGLDEDPRVHFFPAIAMDDAGPFLKIGSHGAFLSHLEILNRCRNIGGPILILQDDCAFSSRLRANSIPKDFDIFYGGYSARNRKNIEASDIVGAHCIAFSPRIIGMLADFLSAEYSKDVPDGEYIAPITYKIFFYISFGIAMMAGLNRGLDWPNHGRYQGYLRPRQRFETKAATDNGM